MSIKINDEVCFLNGFVLRSGKVLKLTTNNLVEIQCDDGILHSHLKYVAAIDAKFCLVQQETHYLSEPLVRFDFTTYKKRNKSWENWTNQESWIKEFFDPYELRQKATVYGLEI